MPGKMMLRQVLGLTILFLGLSLSPVRAQEFQVGLNYLQGIHYTSEWDLFRGGTELTADCHLVREDWQYSAGIGFRTVQWGSQLGLNLGLARMLNDRWEVGAGVQNGLALFRENPLYVFAGGLKSRYVFLKRKKIKLGASLEARYTVCPGYQKYSLVYSLLEVPLGVFVRF
jgi:hypothetical protein